MKKIAILGHQEVTKVVAEHLCDRDLSPAIISLSQTKAKDIKEYVNLKNYCKTKGLHFCELSDYSLVSQKSMDFFLQEAFDIIFVVGWSRLIPESLLELTGPRFIGWHGGPFAPPRCRGRAVVNWSILNNETDFFIYTMILKAGVDDGDIIDMSALSITANETAQSLYLKCAFRLAEMLTSYTSPDFNFKIIPQSLDTPTYLPKRTPVDGEIDWQLPCRVIERLVRALSFPFPPAWSRIKDNLVLIKRVRALDHEPNSKMKIGSIYHVTENDDLVVVTGFGMLLVEEYENVEGILISRGDCFQEAEKKGNATINY